MADPTSRIRPAEPADARALAVIHVTCWRAAYAGIMPDALLAGLSVEDRERSWRRNLETPASSEGHTWLVEVAGRALGFASTGPCRDADRPSGFELWALYLDPAAWGRGLGRALMAFVLADAAARGHDTLSLWVLDGNTRGRRFYEAAGFRADGGAKIEIEGGAELPHLRYRGVTGIAAE